LWSRPHGMDDDLYSLLGVPSTATVEEIRNGYKEKALLHHPDRGGDPFQWTRIARAYETLSGPQRAAYDRTSRLAGGGAESEFAQQFGDGTFDLTDGKPAERKPEKVSLVEQLAQVEEDEARHKGAQRGTVSTANSDSLSHSAGFDAWLRNQRGLGKHSFYNAEDLLRKNKTLGGGIEATDGSAVRLPPLTATAVSFAEHGVPEDVLALEAELQLPAQLVHGEVLVQWLACCMHDEDLVRVATPLSVLNDYPPFNRTGNKWEVTKLPAVAGGEGVGVVVATARNVPHLQSGALDVGDWVVALPDSRLAPIGTWTTLSACDAARLLKVPKGMMPLRQLACARSLCTAYRLLEGYGALKPGDTIIQNGAELPTGQAVIQLCKLLKIRTINLVADDAAFEVTQGLLKGLGATLVLRDDANLMGLLSSVAGEVPRLGLDALGGEHGKRMAMALRPEASLVVYALQHAKLPSLPPSLLLYQQISLHGFSLAQWVSDEGPEAYLAMLEAISQLVGAEKLGVVTRAVLATELSPATLRAALGSHRALGTDGAPRQRSLFVWGDEASAAELGFELREALKAAEAEADAEAPPGPGTPAAAAAAAAAAAVKPRASERWSDSSAMLKELGLAQYTEQFVEEEMTSIELLEEIVSRGDGERELMDALKEMGVKKMGHRQTIVNAVTQRS